MAKATKPELQKMMVFTGTMARVLQSIADDREETFAVTVRNIIREYLMQPLPPTARSTITAGMTRDGRAKQGGKDAKKK